MAGQHAAAPATFGDGGQSILLHHLGDAVVATDLDYRIHTWNPAAEQIYGWRLDEVHGKSVRDILRTQYYGAPEAVYEQVMGDGRWSGEVVQRRADGSTCHILATLSLVRDSDGEPVGVVALNRLIPPVDSARNALDTHMDDALDAGRAAAWTWDPAGDWFDWSDNAGAIHGCASERLGRTWQSALDLVHPDDRERVKNDAADALAASGAYETEYRVIADDGSVRWLICRGRTMRDEEGTLTRLLGTVTDVTDRRRVEDALRVTEERLRAVVTKAPIVLFAFDRDGRFTLAEGAGLARAMSLAAPRMLGNLAAEVFPPESSVADHVARVLADEAFRADVELDGATYDTWYEALHDGGGKVIGGFGVSTDVTDRRRAEDELAHRAVHDPLTGLPNRVLFLDRLGVALRRSKRRGSVTAVLFFDLDRFKLVNDSYGHAVGDDVLVQAADRLRELVRPADTIARFGGDEFVVLCEDLVGELEAVGIAERVVEGLRRPVHIDGVEIYLSTSIGIALASGSGDERPDDLIRDADVAMYRAKDRGRARWELFDEAMRDRAIHQLEIRNALHTALDRAELCLHYQPAIRLSDGALRGVEALVRWQHPQRGLVPPREFIPVAEEAGLMREIGSWVLREACQQVARWNRLVRPALVISVNLSGRQLADEALAEDVARVLAETGADPAHVCLEFSEGELLDDADRVIAVLHQLKNIGVRLAIDDFGAGQSALGYLARIPVDVLKLDKALSDGLRTPRGVAVVKSVIAMAHALGFEAVAEGVESAGQVEKLVALGCDSAQGYFLGRPGEAGTMTGLLR